MNKLNKEKLTDEEVGLFRDLQTRAAMNNGGNIPKEVANNITAMKSVLENISTVAGRKYALSKLLNNPSYGFDKDLYIISDEKNGYGNEPQYKQHCKDAFRDNI